MTTFASERERIKAKIIGIGKPGQEAKFVFPKPKPVFEFHGWVLWHKIRVAFGVTGIFVLGAFILALGGFTWLFSISLFIWLISLILAKPCP